MSRHTEPAFGRVHATTVPPPAAAGAITVQPFGGDAARWDAFVARDPGGTFCHLAAWREIMAEVLGHECLYAVAVDGGGEWCGILPLVRVRSRLFGHYLVSMPFLNYGGPLGAAPARAVLGAAALAEARRSGADLLELRTRGDVGVRGEWTVSHRKQTVILHLPPSADTLWEDVLPSKVRSQVRRPQKEGMEARFGSDQVGAFYEVFARTMRQLGTPVLPRTLFDRAARAFGDGALAGVVYWRGRPVAAGFGFAWGGELELSWAGALREHSRRAPNMLLYWSFMAEAIRRGLGCFNFGRCTPGSSTHRFKRQWGGTDLPLPWLQWSARGVGRTPSPDGLLYRRAAGVWSRLPLAVTNALGPRLARVLP